jgi:translation elongation factor P/translation initiation factor 5A
VSRSIQRLEQSGRVRDLSTEGNAGNRDANDQQRGARKADAVVRHACSFRPSFANLTYKQIEPTNQVRELNGDLTVAAIKNIDIRKGMVFVGEDGQLLQCLDRDLNTPGNWRAILQLKVRNLKTGSITQNRVRPDDKVELAFLETREMQYSYRDGESLVFMDSSSAIRSATCAKTTWSAWLCTKASR